jgi:hypothetical protein
MRRKRLPLRATASRSLPGAEGVVDDALEGGALEVTGEAFTGISAPFSGFPAEWERECRYYLIVTGMILLQCGKRKMR